MNKERSLDPKIVLQSAGYRATPGRIKLLELLAKVDKPLTVAQIQAKLGSKKLDEATLYRALEALAASGVIKRVDLGHAHAHYEFEKTHHHHIVCSNCNTVEDVNHAAVEKELQKMLGGSNQFSVKSIYSHNLEFFGLCNQCSKKIESEK